MAKKEKVKKQVSKKIKEEKLEEIATAPIEEPTPIEEPEQPIEKKYFDEIVENKATLEVVNGDPSVVVPEETEKVEKVVEIKPDNGFKHTFGYLWNGQEMDY